MMAGIRSLFVPGWGQIYDEHPVRGALFMIGGLAAASGVGVAEWRYRDRTKDLNGAEAAYQDAIGTSGEAAALYNRDFYANRADDARQLRQILIGVAGGVVGLSVIEAMASVPRPVGTVLLGAARGRSIPGGRSRGASAYTLTLAHVSF